MFLALDFAHARKQHVVEESKYMITIVQISHPFPASFETECSGVNAAGADQLLVCAHQSLCRIKLQRNTPHHMPT